MPIPKLDVKRGFTDTYPCIAIAADHVERAGIMGADILDELAIAHRPEAIGSAI